MIESMISVELPGMLMTRQAAQIAQQMTAYESRVMLRRGEMTVNAKSLMGLVSLGIRQGQRVAVIADGPDEAQAAEMLSRLLSVSP